MDVDSGDTVPADFHKEKIGRPSGVLRGVPPKRLFASFLHEEKGRGRAFDLLFSKIAFFLRGHTDKPFFQVWPEGHLLSSHEERRQRRAKGESLGTPGSLPAFFLGKPAPRRTPNPSHIKKGCGQGFGVAVFFSSEPNRSPGASGPLVVWTSIQEIPYPPIFIKRKSADRLGCLGGYPLRVSLRPFSTRRKDVVAHLISFSAKSRSFCADIPISRFFRFGLRATFFLHTKKEGKDVPRGDPPWTPRQLADFFSGKPTGGRTTKSWILNKVLRPEDLAAINPWFFGNNKRPPKNGGRLRACYVTISAPARTNICWAALRRTSATNSSGYRLRASDSSRSFRPSSEGSRGFKSSYIFSSRWIIC